MTVQGLAIRIRGQVQGVGFRPFVWQVARAHGITGEVLNDPEGVLIFASGPDLDGFLTALSRDLPPLARVDVVETTPHGFDSAPEGFTIAPSRGTGAETRVTPDAATCPACAEEIRTPGRRHGYAFTNCTHCGPRYTILTALPYDRSRTVMSAFPLCPECRAEYEDPGDRRFHAQPVACPVCGPRLWYETAGQEVAGDPIALAVQCLKSGGIVAMKGLGGFHLACDAANPTALTLLRDRKRRPTKPFALMVTLAQAEALAHLGHADRALLSDAAAPVVLVPSRGTLPEAVAPGMSTLGLMLPYTPLHHLLMDAMDAPLVMTSGNLSGEPQVIGNDEARAKLSAFADGFLLHDRDIARRLDDSVERADPPMILRRARGRVPGVLPLPPGMPDTQVLAVGGQMKGAIALTKGGQVLLGHHLGDLDDALCAAEFEKAIADYRALFDARTQVIAHDLHPAYRATLAATEIARAEGLRLEPVQHHHAHLAACLAENLWPLDGGPVAGIVLDGTGLGPDGTIWGGELLLGDYQGIHRAAHLSPAPLAGGDRTAMEPWRNALVRLDAAGLADEADRLFPKQPRATLRAAVSAGMNAPLSSSAGRLYDAVAACLGLCPARQGYEGEAAMRLEALAAEGEPPYSFGPALDPNPMFQALIRDIHAGMDPARIAGRFQEGLAAAFSEPARVLVESGQAKAVALSGGCFQNAGLLAAVTRRLDGIPLLTHRVTPANDGGLALGQAMVALARIAGTSSATA